MAEHDVRVITLDLLDSTATLLTEQSVSPTAAEAGETGFDLPFPQEIGDELTTTLEASVDGVWKSVDWWRDVGQSTIRLPIEARALRIRELFDTKGMGDTKVHFFEPTAAFAVKPLDFGWPSLFAVNIPEWLSTKWIGVEATPRIDEMVEPLTKLIADFKNLPQDECAPDIAARIIDDKVLELKGKLEVAEQEVDSLEANSNDTLAATFRERLNKVYAEIGRLNAVGATVGKLKQAFEKLASALSALPSIRLAFKNKTDISLPHCERLRISTFFVPVSPNRRRDGRSSTGVGTTTALSLLALGLFLLAWRVNGAWPLNKLSYASLGPIFSNSQEAMVAFLLVFPALVATQLDRGLPSYLPTRVIVARERLALNLSLGIPIILSVLAIGNPMPRLFTGALVVGGVALSANALFSYAFTSGWLSTRSHKRVALEAEA